ncbi:hypothetical protein EMIHUDRAFT_221726 [Emiliania huxleyi CCMP1516]|uniref:CAF1B/HIR1 beta-propeller domain-containing protein n=2 Tax=Emiliania huxleyi TaxID=2903 RepID=A0A0D3HY38_EMIH1|nr:hypothetical protein EMIHUDRAFT_221726 [Emiliania huxleyi CCMP1516]EOD03923.1 hypothetical protein EMIHUDRAFT_221726 [Emiliania huxleyi CCMP1516]|eukprot:XP_005756352.1 hypothetical protein EMIHUDRAFT_221726 [Emiliania huxleyi CCMP1516]
MFSSFPRAKIANDMTLGASPDQLRLFTPEIFWHGREEGKRFVPGSIQGVDVSASGLIATAGNDSKVRLWRLGEAPPAEAAEAPAVVLYQELDAVNAVRFSPDGATLASAADDNLIILWRDTGTRQQASFGSSAPQGEGTWKQHCVLRGHIDDGCVDGSCIVWGVSAAGAAGKGVRPMQQQLRDHEHYVQGVCWDPRGELVASVSCDRSARVYKAQPAAGKGAAPSFTFTCAYSIQKTNLIVYDSQQRTPLLVASGMHYAALTDLAWLPAGRGLIVSSADGFCSILLLAPGALGEPLPEEELPSCMRPPAAPVEAHSDGLQVKKKPKRVVPIETSV